MPPIDPNSGSSTRPEPIHTQDDLLAALQAAHAVPETAGWLSVSELVARTGMSRSMILKRLLAIHVQGALETQRTLRLAIDGTMRPTIVYRTKPKA